MYAVVLIIATLFVPLEWTVGFGLILSSAVAPWIPQRWVLSRVQNVRGRVFAAGLVVVVATTAVFLAVDLMLPDSPGPRSSGVWASGMMQHPVAGRTADFPEPHE